MNLLQRRVTPSRNGSCALAGISVLVTGFTDDSAARTRCSTLVQQLGGTLLADLPPTVEARLSPRSTPNPHHGPACTLSTVWVLVATVHWALLHPTSSQMQLTPGHITLQACEHDVCDPPAEVVVVSDRAMRTLKYVYAVAAGHAVVKLSWLEVRSQFRQLRLPPLRVGVRSSPGRVACARRTTQELLCSDAGMQGGRTQGASDKRAPVACAAHALERIRRLEGHGAVQ